jgi:hypothetical protein
MESKDPYPVKANDPGEATLVDASSSNSLSMTISLNLQNCHLERESWSAKRDSDGVERPLPLKQTFINPRFATAS